ncbi:unnamed protein product [Closterium sp. NIES-65]|nr:unnamed protein product [Closterium sp. NIES-65]
MDNPHGSRACSSRPLRPPRRACPPCPSVTPYAPFPSVAPPLRAVPSLHASPASPRSVTTAAAAARSCVQPDGCGREFYFKANFSFTMLRSGKTGGDGLAFVISKTAAAGTQGGMGYGGMERVSMAVEFDTWLNKEDKDASNNHVGVNVNGSAISKVSVKSKLLLNSGMPYFVWVEYSPAGNGTLNVSLATMPSPKPAKPMLSTPLSLCDVLEPIDASTSFYFGFVASSRAQFTQQHTVGITTVETGYAPASTLSHRRESCWAYAVVASVEAAYGIANNSSSGSYPSLSVDSLYKLMGLPSCSQGSPSLAFKRLTELAATSGGLEEATPRKSPVKKYVVSGFERTAFKGYFGLLLAVQRQPVVVHIQASADSFI